MPFPPTPPMTPAKQKTKPMSQTVPRIAPNKESTQGLGLTFRPKRHRKIQKDAILGIRKPAIRRIARRGGVKRFQSSIYQTTRDVITDRIREVLSRVVTIVEHCNRKTVTTVDIVFALKDLPYYSLNPVYGFEWPVKEFPEKRVATRAPIRDESVGFILTQLSKEQDEEKVRALLASSQPEVQTRELSYIPFLSPAQSRESTPPPILPGPAWAHVGLMPFGWDAPPGSHTPSVTGEALPRTRTREPSPSPEPAPASVQPKSPSPESLSVLRTAAWISDCAVTNRGDHNDNDNDNDEEDYDDDDDIFPNRHDLNKALENLENFSNWGHKHDIDNGSDLSSDTKEQLKAERRDAREIDAKLLKCSGAAAYFLD